MFKYNHNPSFIIFMIKLLSLLCLISLALTACINTRCAVCETTNGQQQCKKCRNIFEQLQNGPNVQCVCENGLISSLPDSQCLPCSQLLPGCQQCSVSTFSPYAYKCTLCTQNWILNSTTGTCSCPQNQLWSTDGLICGECFEVIRGCQTCSDSATCTLCGPNQNIVDGKCVCSTAGRVVNNQGSCVNCNVAFPGCTQCYNNICTQCSSGYFYTLQGTCVCPQDCLTCNSNGCLTCPVGSRRVQNATLGRYECQDCSSNCNTCNSNGCTVCETGYYLNNRTCTACPGLTCGACSSATTCNGCIEGYFLSGPNTCSQCHPSCESCSVAAACDTCEQGKFKNTATDLCQSCQTGCNECASATVCNNCDDGYGYIPATTTCVSCSGLGFGNCIDCTGEECLLCAQNNILDNGVCTSCNTLGCATCQSDGTCNSCLQGLQLHDGLCLSTICASRRCSLCDSTGQNCFRCRPSYVDVTLNQIISNHVTVTCDCPEGNISENAIDYYCYPCEKVLFGCAICAVTNRDPYTIGCAQCNTTWVMDTNGVCQCQAPNVLSSDGRTCAPCSQAIPGCLTCNSQGKCTNCATGFNVSNGVCICRNASQAISSNGSCAACATAISGCTSCLNSQCQSCGVGKLLWQFNMPPFPNGVCVCDFSNCLTCNANGCQTCEPGFYRTIVNPAIGNQCVKCPDIGCTSCNVNNPSRCTACEGGFYLSSQDCIPCDLHCQNCTTGGACTSCVSPYQLIGNQCVICTPHCSNCAVSGCQSCNPGFYLSANTCQPCQIQGCTTCASNNYCTSCQSGYNNTNGYCFLVCSIGCATCDSTGCTTCQQNYIKNGTQCSPAAVCPTGTYLNGTACIPCIQNRPGCLSCLNSSICTECSSGYNLSQGNCVSTCQSPCLCSNGACVGCPSGYFLSNNNCNLCGVNCVNCNNPANCLTCASGYIPFNGVCTLINCPSGSYLGLNNICVACNSTLNCLQCTNGSACTSCPSNYNLNANGVCVFASSCGVGCTSCVNSICYACNSSLNLIYNSGTRTCICPVNATQLANGTCQCPTNQVFNSSTGTCQCQIGFVSGPSGCTCATTSYVSPSGVCTPCASSCLTCSSNICCTSCDSSRGRRINGCVCQCIPFVTCS